MTITVHYSAQIKQAAGIAEESVDIESGCSAQDLISRVAERHGEPLRGFLVDESGAFRTNNLLVVGDEQVDWATPRALHDGDVVTILPPISGGRALGGAAG